MVTPARVAWGRPHRQELWDSLDLGKAHSIPQSRRSASLNSALSCKTTFCPDDRDPNRHSVALWGLCLGAAMVPSRLVFAAQSWAGQSHPGGRCPGSVLCRWSVPPPSRARARPRGHSRSCGRCPLGRRVPAAAPGAARARSGRSACPAPGHCVVTGVVSFHVLGAPARKAPLSTWTHRSGG